MSELEKALKEHAYSVTMAVETMVEAMGMHAENQQRSDRGEALAYTQEHFAALCVRKGCHHDAFMQRWEVKVDGR